jgi:hypothetical protein
VSNSVGRSRPEISGFRQPFTLALGLDRNIYTSEIDGPQLTPATARQRGAALIAAADEAETIAGCNRITIS